MKRNLLSVLILALLIVNIVLSAIMMISVTGTNKKTAQLVTDIATVMSLEYSKPGGDVSSLVPNVAIEDTDIHTLSPMTILLAPDADGKQAYMMATISFSINKTSPDYKKKSGQILDGSVDQLIMDTVNTVVGQYTADEIRADMDGLKKEILTEIQQLTGSDMIYRVNISDIKLGGS